MNKTPINIVTLQSILMGIARPTFATIVMETVPKMNKKGREDKLPNPYEGFIIKRTKAHVLFKFDYENSVNNQRIREGKDADFVAQGRVWGNHLENSTLISNGDKLYAQFKYNKPPTDSKYIDTRTGQEVNKDLLKQYLPPVSAGSNTQNLDNEVGMATVRCSNIKELVVNQHHYVLV